MTTSPKGVYDAEGRRKYLSKAEGRKFLEATTRLPRPPALFCQTIYYTGCRISEALALRGQDIDIAVKVILIRSLKKRNRKGVRRIPVPEFLVSELLEIAPPPGDAPIWSFSRSTGWRIVKRMMRAAGISGAQATAKGLRHGFGVRGAMKQIPVSLIQHWMGHADPSTTAIYLDVRDDEERTLIEKTW